RSAVATSFTAVPVEAAVTDPVDAGFSGRSVLPSSKRTWPGAMPNASAAIWDIDVYVPQPISCVPARTHALPSGSMRATAAAAPRRAGYVAVAMPHPTSHRPLRVERGAGLRRLQPKRPAADS